MTTIGLSLNLIVLILVHVYLILIAKNSLNLNKRVNRLSSKINNILNKYNL